MFTISTKQIEHAFSENLIDWLHDNRFKIEKTFRKKFPLAKNYFNLELPPIDGAKKHVAFNSSMGSKAYYKGSYKCVLPWKSLKRIGAPSRSSIAK